MTAIAGFDTYDVRFPTSTRLDGSDAMNRAPDYSAAALVIRTDSPGGLARRAGKPLWLYLADLTPEQIVAMVDFRYLTDALTPDEALQLLERAAPGREERTRILADEGYPAYTTTPGWLGYSDDHLAHLCADAVRDGFHWSSSRWGRGWRKTCGAAGSPGKPSVRKPGSHWTPTRSGV